MLTFLEETRKSRDGDHPSGGDINDERTLKLEVGLDLGTFVKCLTGP